MKHTGYALTALLLFGLVAAATLPVSVQGQAKAKDSIILHRSKVPLGGVKFDHKKHSEQAGVKCETCHHPSKPEKPMQAANQVCSDCHSKAATPPMKTNYLNAFHKPTGQTGLCIDCHKQSNAKGSKAPVTCVTCHNKANVAG